MAMATGGGFVHRRPLGRRVRTSSTVGVAAISAAMSRARSRWVTSPSTSSMPAVISGAAAALIERTSPVLLWVSTTRPARVAATRRPRRRSTCGPGPCRRSGRSVARPIHPTSPAARQALAEAHETEPCPQRATGQATPGIASGRAELAARRPSPGGAPPKRGRPRRSSRPPPRPARSPPGRSASVSAPREPPRRTRSGRAAPDRDPSRPIRPPSPAALRQSPADRTAPGCPAPDASAAGTTGRRSLIAATCSSDGSPPARNGKPADSTSSRNAGGPTVRTSSPRR